MCYDLEYTDAFDTDDAANFAAFFDWWFTFKCVMHGGQNSIKRGMDLLTSAELLKMVHIMIASLINGLRIDWNHNRIVFF